MTRPLSLIGILALTSLALACKEGNNPDPRLVSSAPGDLEHSRSVTIGNGPGYLGKKPGPRVWDDMNYPQPIYENETGPRPKN